MTEQERQDARILLAEKVMRWKPAPSAERVVQWCAPQIGQDDAFWIRSVNRGQRIGPGHYSWDPFSHPADAVEVMMALRDQGFAVCNIANGDGYHSMVNVGIIAEAASGSTFAETLTTAIHRLVVERPELFTEEK